MFNLKRQCIVNHLDPRHARLLMRLLADDALLLGCVEVGIVGLSIDHAALLQCHRHHLAEGTLTPALHRRDEEFPQVGRLLHAHPPSLLVARLVRVRLVLVQHAHDAAVVVPPGL